MGKSQYILKFGGLPTGVHEYTFEITGTFFNGTEYSEISRAGIVVNARLTKQNNLMQIHFELQGTVGIECDRCLKDFDFPIHANEDLVIRHGKPSESTDEILVVPEGQDEVDISHYLYEYITLALPARRVPCELDEERFECDEDTLKRLEDLSHEGAQDNNENNPMWEQLSKIKYNKN